MFPVKKTPFLVYLQTDPHLFACHLPTIKQTSQIEDVLKVTELVTGLSAEWLSIRYIDQCDLNLAHRLHDLHVVNRSYFTAKLPEDLAQLLRDVCSTDMRKIFRHGLRNDADLMSGKPGEYESNWRTPRNRLAIAWMVAARCGLQQVCASLLALGAEVNTTTKYGRTALHIAAALGDKRILQFLAQKGADLRVTDSDGLSPLAIARKFGHLAFARCLNQLDWSARVRNMRPRFLDPPLKAFQLCDSAYPKWRRDPTGRTYLQKTTKLQQFAGNGLNAPPWKWPDLEVKSAKKRPSSSVSNKEFQSPTATRRSRFTAYATHCARLNKQHEQRVYPRDPFP